MGVILWCDNQPRPFHVPPPSPVVLHCGFGHRNLVPRWPISALVPLKRVTPLLPILHPASWKQWDLLLSYWGAPLASCSWLFSLQRETSMVDCGSQCRFFMSISHGALLPSILIHTEIPYSILARMVRQTEEGVIPGPTCLAHLPTRCHSVFPVAMQPDEAPTPPAWHWGSVSKPSRDGVQWTILAHKYMGKCRLGIFPRLHLCRHHCSSRLLPSPPRKIIPPH